MFNKPNKYGALQVCFYSYSSKRTAKNSVLLLFPHPQFEDGQLPPDLQGFDDVSAWPAFFILSENPFFISLKYSPPIASAAGQAQNSLS